MVLSVRVGFLLFSCIEGTNKLFVVNEHNSLSGTCKKKGILSFPVEAMSQEDASPRDTIQRLLRHKMGIAPDEVQIIGISPKHFSLLRVRVDTEIRYGYGVLCGDPHRPFIPGDHNTDFVGWKSMTELYTLSEESAIEVYAGVSIILSHFGGNGYPQVSAYLRSMSGCMQRA